ncbi:MAG TPA: Bax inhibitor-1/YccA family protein [Anaerolineales bacterium]|nr:Bax inhibitor-1/YccA family protein [Anaerolineales bacterium]
METQNPVLKTKYFQPSAISDAAEMTVQGVALKTLFLLALVGLAGAFSWSQYAAGNWAILVPLIIAGLLGGLVIALVIVFKQTWAPFLAPVYAVLEGLAIGAISAFFETSYPGIVIQAVLLTFGVLFAMLFVYVTRIIKVTPGFRTGVMLATFGIALAYLGTFLLSLFGIRVPFIHQTGWVGIAISLVIVGVAALNLLLDFDFIERAAANRAPKHMEWFGAFGLVVTLIWLYLELLRLLGRFRSR